MFVHGQYAWINNSSSQGISISVYFAPEVNFNNLMETCNPAQKPSPLSQKDRDDDQDATQFLLTS